MLSLTKKLLFFASTVLAIFVTSQTASAIENKDLAWWNSTTEYPLGKVILYNNTQWYALSKNLGRRPGTEQSGWIRIDQLTNTSLSWWNTNTQYDADVIVLYNNTRWFARWISKGERPGQPYVAWERLADKPANATPTPAPMTTAAPTPISTTKPTPAPTSQAGATPSPTPNNSGIGKPNTNLRVFQFGSHETIDPAITKKIQAPAVYSTGYWVNAGEPVIMAYHIANAATASRGQIAIVDENEFNTMIENSTELQIGSNFITAPKAGLIVFISVDTLETTSAVHNLEILSGGSLKE